MNEVPAGHPVAVLLNEEMAMVGIEEGERETHVLPAAPATIALREGRVVLQT